MLPTRDPCDNGQPRWGEGCGMNEQRSLMLERISEDEGLVGDLAGAAAESLRSWAQAQALTEAQSPTLDDRSVSQRISLIRSVSRSVADRAAHASFDPVTEAQRQYQLLCGAPDTTMAIRTGPLRPVRPVAPPKLWWQRLLFWRSK